MNNGTEFKILSKFEPKFRSKSLENKDTIHAKELYSILDKVVIDLNKDFVPLLEEHFSKLINTIGSDEIPNTLKQQLKKLRDEIDELKSMNVIDPTDEDQWEAPQFKGDNIELIAV
ncbi:hypothetical protein [Wolbachia endosymbiont of Nilaparvata lugens]|uniref:hypothetical protein n=1 Tax=Wolbachia endosymbiont of Nilaparvata lugens TaxID=357143 RepID=UPI00117C6D4C|nr:hypothetical protein [Wolbachia endosymbiont of Nilaparvata lugens]